MKRAFPDVDPYIEAEGFWEDFHRTFINYLREAILEGLPPGYDARIDERIELTDPETGRSIRIPDVGVVESPSNRGARAPSATGGVGTLTTPEPAVVEMGPVSEQREVWIEVRDLRDESLVTSIEVLSPTNKSSDGFGVYKRKRQHVLDAHANLVEIDLLLQGNRLSFRTAPPAAHFYVYLTRIEQLPKVFVYPWKLTDRLPGIPIPLRPPDPDVWVNLAAVYETAFVRGQYPRRLRYAQPPADLPPNLAEWSHRQARALTGQG